MSGIDTNSAHVGIKKASTWGTEVAITSTGAMRLRPSALTIAENRNVFNGRDIGAGRKSTSFITEEANVPVSASFDSTFGQPFLAILASIMGTEGNATETTVGEGDYSHAFDLADNVYSSNKIIWSLGHTIEDATARLVVPSVKFNAFTFQADANKVGTWTFQGVGNKVDYAPTTTAANLAALSYTTDYEEAPLGGANIYFRLNEYSDAALDSGDNKAIEYVSIELNRTLTPEWVIQGANSPYIVEPREQGLIVGRLIVRFREINASAQDVLAWRSGATKLKAELFVDGAQIGAGVNTSLKFQFPYMQVLEWPGGYDLPNNNTLMKPTVTFNLMKASAAPTGMTGVTDYLRITSIDRHTTKWTA